jgi:acyl dehydratase
MEASARVVTDMAGVPALAGTELGVTGWRTMTQAEVDAFADLTNDHQFIHVDPERARHTRFGGTIAHGYLTLSMIGSLFPELLEITDIGEGVNYGLDRVRFPAPLRVGSNYRGRARVGDVTEVEGGLQMNITVTVEEEGEAKPSCVADCIFRFYSQA